MPIKKSLFLLVFILALCTICSAQTPLKRTSIYSYNTGITDFKIRTRNYSVLIGAQKGKYTFIELGAERRWTKVRLVHQKMWALGGTMEYNFGNNVLGYKVAVWKKTGRINLTYGANLCYLTDFNNARWGGGPQIGFRLLGFHLINGYNFTFGDSAFKNYNKLYLALRFSIPLDKKIKFKK